MIKVTVTGTRSLPVEPELGVQSRGCSALVRQAAADVSEAAPLPELLCKRLIDEGDAVVVPVGLQKASGFRKGLWEACRDGNYSTASQTFVRPSVHS